MATTATLNGGPTGGLHATSTLIHSENPPQEETCRVESNSSFESGNDEILQHSTVLPGDNNPSVWSTCEGLDRSFDSESQTADFRGSMDAKGKKRRKQSRPVRIPATELPLGPGREHGSLLSESAGTGSEGDEAGELSTEKDLYNPEAKSLQKEKSGNEKGILLPATLRQQLPLNLKYEPDSESGGQQHNLLVAQSSSVLTSCLNVQPTGNNNNSSIETDKTEAAGQGTKSSPSPLTRVLTGSASPTISRQQFSPPLFSSPFAAIFPTASSQVGNYFQQQSSNLQQNNSTSSSIHASGHPPPGTPNSTSSTGSNQNGQGGSSLTNMPPHRIFNPEAYCDLCNKEFCNKYFLKTHKANKHGVYSEVSSASLTSNQILAAAISSSPSNSNFLSINHSSVNNPLTQCSQQPQQIVSAASSSSSSASSMLKSVSSSAAAVENPFSFCSSFSTGEKNGTNNNTTSSSALQLQRESFCELCQKEFCNKYFLKRHKAKIHGIPIPPESKCGSTSGKSSRHGFSNGMNEKRSVEETLSGLPTLRDIGLETLGMDLVAKHLEESAGSSGPNESMHQREETDMANSDESNAPPSTFQSELMSAAAAATTSGGGESARLRSPENLGENSSFKLSSLELKPQQLGASNAENTCQFCFREFPSQQLLRSHIIKKHRLLLQSAFPPFLLSFQPMPPAFDDPAATESAALDSNGNNAEVDYECNICNRSFQTIYLLRMHKSYFHPESEQETSDPLTAKLLTEAASMFTQGGGDGGSPGGRGEGGKSSNGKDENEGDTDQGFDSDAEPEGKSDSANKTSANIEIENRGEGTSDSDDLRRLQTMIMELNRVSTNTVAWSPPLANVSTSPNTSHFAGQAGIGSSLVCPICSKEFYSSYFLQQHIQHYHSSSSLFPPDSSGGGVRVKIESPLGEISSGGMGKKMNETGSMSGSSGSSTQKDRGDGTVGDTAASILSGSAFLTPGPKGTSGGSPSKSDSGGDRGSGSGPVKRPSPSLSRSYCTICHKELCNKYFMRTHMLKMHGISIESSTGLGGVTCDICNKELCSKYFLKVHKQNTHGIMEDGPSPPNPSTPGPPTQTLPNFPIVTPPIMNLSTGATVAVDAGSPVGQGEVSPSFMPKDVSERFFNNFAEICPLCGKKFRSSKWLKSHLQSDHGQEGRDKWKAIEKSLSLQRRSPKSASKGGSNTSINNIASSSCKSGIGGGGSNSSGKSSGGGNGNGGQKQSYSGSVDGNKCALCGFSSGDAEVMRSHLIKEHGNQLGAASAHGLLGDAVASGFPEGSQGLVLDPLTMLFQKMEGGSSKLYRCSYCPFTTSLLVYLYAHERTHTGLANTNPVTQDAKCPFQCPMCFHSFSQPEAFQQHLLGHQMSGVLAPFFTPTAAAAAAAASSSCQYALLTQSESDPSGDSGGGGGLMHPSFLNGSSGNASSLYMALNANKARQQDDDGKTDKSDQDDGTAADLTTTRKRHYQGAEDNNESSRKSRKISHFRCTSCQARFNTRTECISHIHEDHKGNKVVFKVISTVIRKQREGHRVTRTKRKRGNKIFRCRKCRFTCSTYTNLMVHSKLHHSFFRPGSMSSQEIGAENISLATRETDGHVSPTVTSGTASSNNNVTTAPGLGAWKLGNLPEGRGVPQEGVGDGDFIMQGFLLTSSEEESSNQSGYFVPSLVYLPVREKVSQSIRVSFSLTPTP